MKKLILPVLLVILVAFVISCSCKPGAGPSPTSILTPTAKPSEPTPAESEATAPPTHTPTPTEALSAPTPIGLPPLPPDPQRIEFQAEDGQALVGTYYPAAVNPAPVVVLMHWAPGDQDDWPAIAAWLQNRGLEVAPGGSTWLDPTWFPPMLEGQSFAVFAFTFRGCEGGCSAFKPEGWLLDAKAAVKTASELEGVDPQRMAAIGASIGADGAVDACGEGCLGGLSLSPGSYLKVDYAEAVAAADGAGKIVWCLAGEEDAESATACRSASGDHYRMVLYVGGDHGMMLIKPGADPETLELILDFLKLTFGLD
jgi:dienelactone hydrolase